MSRVVVVLVGLAGFGLPGPAAATYALNGCQFSRSGTVYVTYFDVTASNRDRFDETRRGWNKKQSQLWFDVSGLDPGYPSATIDLFDGMYDNASRWGTVKGACDSGSWSFNRVKRYLNNAQLAEDGLSQKERRFVVSHEIGLAGGLAHNTSGTDLCGETIMKADACVSQSGVVSDPPWAIDISGFNAIY